MTDFNTRIAELNKEYSRTQEQARTCKYCLEDTRYCREHSRKLSEIQAKIELLNEMRDEKIKEVKKLMAESVDDFNNNHSDLTQSQKNEIFRTLPNGKYCDCSMDGVCDFHTIGEHIKSEWNIEDKDLL